jgi:hypothetical protein
LALLGIRSRRRDDRHRDARRRFANVVSYGMPRLILLCSKSGVRLWSICVAALGFVVLASCVVMSRRSYSTCGRRNAIPMLIFSIFGIWCRPVACRLRDACRRLAGFFRNDIPILVFHLFDLCGRRGDRRRDVRSRFANVVPYGLLSSVLSKILYSFSHESYTAQPRSSSLRYLTKRLCCKENRGKFLHTMTG